MFALIKLIAREFSKSFFGPFFIFVFPLLLLLIIGSINKAPINIMLPGLIASGFVSITANGMAITMVEYKNSVIIKRIAITPVKKSDFILALILFYTVVLFISAGWLLLWAFIVFGKGGGVSPEKAQQLMTDYYKSFSDPNSKFDMNTIHFFFYRCVDWSAFFIALIVDVLFAITLGTIIVALSGKSVNRANLFATILIPLSFLTGGFMPLNLIDKNQVLFIISHCLPMRYSSNLMINTFVANLKTQPLDGIEYNIVKILLTSKNHKYVTNAFDDIAINLPVVVGSTLVFGYFSAKLYRWE